MEYSVRPKKKPRNLDNLSENNIKRAALGFLKSYYRYRQRLGETTLRLNMRAEGGIIIDGYLSFRESEEKLFTATVEATSLLTKEEIRYKVNKALLTWDSVAAGMVVTTIFFALGHFRELFSVPQMGGALLWSFLLAFSIFLFHAIYRLFFSKLRRYRYIYGFEQFKRFFADERWIAIGENVFPDPEDPYLLELREQ